MKRKVENKGFTLIELLVTVAILGILAAVLVPSYVQYISSTKAKVCEVNRLQFVHSFKVYKVYDGGNYSLADAVSGGVAALSAEKAGLKCPSGGEITAASSGTTASINCKLHGSLTVDMSDIGGGGTGGGGTETPVLPGAPNGSWSGLCEYIAKNFASPGEGLNLPQGSLYEYKGSLYAVGWSFHLKKSEAEAFASSPVAFASTNQNFHKLDLNTIYKSSNVTIDPKTQKKTWNPPLFQGAVYTDDTSSYIYLGTDPNGSQNLPQGNQNGNWVKLKTGITGS